MPLPRYGPSPVFVTVLSAIIVSALLPATLMPYFWLKSIVLPPTVIPVAFESEMPIVFSLNSL